MAIRIIVGLANPTEHYAATRHNAGAWYVEQLLSSSGLQLKSQTKLCASVAKYQAGVSLAIPSTYMNESGRAIAAILQYYKIATQELLIAHDDIDLPPGTVKLKYAGGHGGHNGLRDTMSQLKTDGFWRLRIGVGRPQHKSQVTKFVLERPPKTEKQAIDQSVDQATDITPLLFEGKFEQAMLILHTR